MAIYLPQQKSFMDQFLSTGIMENIMRGIMARNQNLREDQETARGYQDAGYTEIQPRSQFQQQNAGPQNEAERQAFAKGPSAQEWGLKPPDVSVGGGRGLLGSPQRGFRKPPEVEYKVGVETFKDESGKQYPMFIKRTKDGKYVAAQNLPSGSAQKITRKTRTRTDLKTGITYQQEYRVDHQGKEVPEVDPNTGKRITPKWTVRKKPTPPTNIILGSGKPGEIIVGSSKGKLNLRTEKTPGGGSVNPKTTARLSAEQQKAVADLGDIERIASEVEKEFDPNFVGPVVGRARGISSKFVSDPKFTSFKNKASQLRAVVYGLSGKQINEAELKWLKEDILPALSQPSANYKATLKVLREWVAKKRASTSNAFKEQGYIVGGSNPKPSWEQEETVPPNGRKPLSSF